MTGKVLINPKTGALFPYTDVFANTGDLVPVSAEVATRIVAGLRKRMQEIETLRKQLEQGEIIGDELVEAMNKLQTLKKELEELPSQIVSEKQSAAQAAMEDEMVEKAIAKASPKPKRKAKQKAKKAEATPVDQADTQTKSAPSASDVEVTVLPDTMEPALSSVDSLLDDLAAGSDEQ